nr:Uncharacterised protein [Klebsiella pneumoniae]
MTLATRTVTLPGGLQATRSISRRRIVRLPWRGSPPAATTNRRASLGWRTCWNICCFTAESATGMMTD